MRKLSHAYILSIWLVLLLVSLCTAQEKMRTVDESDPAHNHPNTPIAIVSREIREKSFSKGSQLRGDKDWLRYLRLGVKNPSGKTITYFYLELIIERQGKLPSSTRLGIPLSFGNPRAPLDIEMKAAGIVSPLMKPGEIINLSVSESSMEYWRKYLIQYDVEDFDRVAIDIRHVHYDDGTGWALGFETRQDPAEPSRWVVVNPNKPGSPSRLKTRFSEWLKSFFSLDRPSSGVVFGTFLPARSRFFFNYSESSLAPPLTPPVTCRWYLDTIFPACFPAVDSCSPPLPPGCHKPRDNTSDIDEGAPGTLGSLISQPTQCVPADGSLSGVCNDCTPPASMVWQAGCGGSCNQQPDTTTHPPSGCVAPYENINGVCQRPVSYQQSCAPPAPYDPNTCVCPNGTITPTPTPDPCSVEQEASCYNQGPGWNWDTNLCWCRWQPPEIGGGCDRSPGGCWDSPVVVDVLGNGFNLSDYFDGVFFDLNSDGVRERLSWTSAGSDDAWLALDRNGNGMIDNGRELFGNYTAQPYSPNPNGFIALRVFDEIGRGGNNDGSIDRQDAVFARLRLWQDINHNGVSEQSELHALTALGVAKLDLDYRESRRRDRHGNLFKYRAKVGDAQGFQVGRWAWDVFLVTQP